MTGAIVQIVADGSPGGGTTVVLGLCEDLKRTVGAQIILITQKDSYAASAAKALGIEVFELEFFSSRFDLTIRAKLEGIIEKIDPLLIHAHGARAAYHLRSMRKRPFVYTVHGYHFVRKSIWVRPLFVWAERVIARSAAVVVFVSESDRRTAFAYRILGSEAHNEVIGNGVDPTDLNRILPEQRERNEVVFLGRMHRQKNPALAVQMMDFLEDLPITLTMVGGGEMLDAIRNLCRQSLARDRITIVGPVARAEALEILRRANILVFPSLWEGMPVAPMEAMYLGVPVVASAIAGTDEVVVDGETGQLIAPPTGKNFADAIRALFLDDAERNRMSNAAMALAEKKFLRSVNSRRHIALYSELCSVENF